MALTGIKLVVFDLDGTLLDSAPDIATAANQTLQALGRESLSESQIRNYVGNGADVLLARALSRSVTVDPKLSDALRQEARGLFDDFYAQTGHQQSRLYQGVISTLERLHQGEIAMALLTNKPSQFIPAILAQHQLGEYFVEVIGGDTFAAKKPDPMALLWLMQKHQLNAEQVLMVGDSKHDIQAAKNAGCRSLGVTYGYNHGEPIEASQPDFVANQLSELLHLTT